jgi:hypothetical protein
MVAQRKRKGLMEPQDRRREMKCNCKASIRDEPAAKSISGSKTRKRQRDDREGRS